MNDLEVIGKWVKDPNRSFKEGIAIRDKYKINSDKDAFYGNANADNPTGVQVNMLLQDITRILIKLRNNPKLMEAKVVQVIASKKPIIASPLPIRPTKVKIESNKVKEEDLPDNLKPVYCRIKEIMPLIGAKHANLKAAKDDATAKQLSNDIEALDMEKKACWKLIDKFYNQKGVTLNIIPEESSDDTVESPLEKIMKIEEPDRKTEAINKREKIVVDDIAKAKKKLAEFKKNKPHLVKSKENSIARKEQELKSLQDARAAIKGNK